MSYELDVWGKYRSGALASENDLTASRYYRETVRIGVAADVANAYFRLRAADAELGVLESTLKLRTETATLQKDRFEGGLIGEYDVRQAEAERFAVIADIARAKRAIGQYETAIAILTGRSPQAVFAPDVARGIAIDATTAVPPLPLGLPVEVISRRPDIRRNEALLAGSELRIQQARANYYPSIRLGAFFGTEAATMGNLFTGPAQIWSIGMGLLQPLVALKAIEAQVELAKANNDAAMVAYLQTVQVAFGEVSQFAGSQCVVARSAGRRNGAPRPPGHGARSGDVALQRGAHVVPRGDRRAALAAGRRNIAHRRRARSQAVDGRLRQVARRRLESGAAFRGAVACPGGQRRDGARPPVTVACSWISSGHWRRSPSSAAPPCWRCRVHRHRDEGARMPDRKIQCALPVRPAAGAPQRRPRDGNQ